jgi:tetratricopeptide (TPR) repeat protein
MFALDWKGAREDYDASLAVNPNSSFTWSMFTILKLLTRDFNKIDELEKTIKAIDPLDPVANGMVANMYLYSGQLEKAELVCDEFLKVSPQGGYIAMVSIFVKAARYGWATAIPALEAVKSVAGPFTMLMAVLGAAYAATGDREKAMECIDWLKQTEARTPGAVLDHVAMVYAQLGMEDEFFATVERGYRNRSIISLWIYDSYFLPESLRRHERLKNIRRQAGLAV